MGIIIFTFLTPGIFFPYWSLTERWERLAVGCQCRVEAVLEAAHREAKMSLDLFPTVLCIENLMCSVNMEEFLSDFHLKQFLHHGP